MSRSRNIKPGFFQNEKLADLPFEYRLLFQGLWCEADREGRLEDRPKRLKVKIFPYDNVDIEHGLAALQRAGFILRYSAEGLDIIQVVAFCKHQNPHKKEQLSELPGYIPGQDREFPAQAPEIPEHARLIPDSLNLIPDSLQERAPRSPNGSRLPPDWQPSESDIAYCKANRPELDWRRVAENFRDYWLAKAGKDARKADWPRTWQRWVRNEGPPKNSQARPLSKTAEAFLTLEGMKSGNQLDSGRDFEGPPKTAGLIARTDTGR